MRNLTWLIHPALLAVLASALLFGLSPRLSPWLRGRFLWGVATATSLAPSPASARRAANPELVAARARIAALENELASLQSDHRAVTTTRNALSNVDLPRLLTASIVGNPRPSSLVHQAVIDRGSSHGLVPGSPVLVSGILVGYVTVTAKASAELRLLSDPRSRARVHLVRTGQVGMLLGIGAGQPLRLRPATRDADVQVGDIVAVDRDSSVGPHGVAVGRVTAVQRQAGDLLPHVEVEPLVPLEELTAVTLVISLAPETPNTKNRKGGEKGARTPWKHQKNKRAKHQPAPSPSTVQPVSNESR